MKISDAFTPNRVVDKRTESTIIGGWIVITLLLWFASPSVFFPKPGEILQAMADLWKYSNLGAALIASLMLNIEAILFSTVISLALAYLNTIPAMRPLIVFIGKLRFLSLVGLSFFFVLMASGEELKLSILVFAVTVFFVVGMVDVILNIPQEQYDLAKTLRMSDWETLYEVVILGQIDQAFVVLRQNAAMSWMFLSTVEGMSRSGGGIGGLLLDSNRHFHLAEVFAIQFMILGLGLLQDYGLGVFRNLVCPYAVLTRSRA